MPDITREEVAHLADLARIDLSDAELDHLAPQLAVILDFLTRAAVITSEQIAKLRTEPGGLPRE